MFARSYHGLVNGSYRIESALTGDDAAVIAGGEDGRLQYWDLVTVNDIY